MKISRSGPWMNFVVVPVLLCVNTLVFSQIAKYSYRIANPCWHLDVPESIDPNYKPPYRLEVGDIAPDFELSRVGSNDVVRLSDFRGNKPVVLIFGSYT